MIIAVTMVIMGVMATYYLFNRQVWQFIQVCWVGWVWALVTFLILSYFWIFKSDRKAEAERSKRNRAFLKRLFEG